MDTQEANYQEAKKRVDARTGFYMNLGMFVIMNAVFLVAFGAWWLWVTAFWGLGVALHGFSVFVGNNGRVRDWQERSIKKEMQRDADAGPTA